MSDNTPLLVQFPESEQQERGLVGTWNRTFHQTRQWAQRSIKSRAKHWVVLVLVILDVAGILSDIFIGLITCELGREDESWVGPTRQGLTTFSLVMSCVFMLELIMSVLADGLEYFKEKLHCFDAFVIVMGFAVDLLEHNVVEEIASLVVILRLWRFVKIVDEFSVEASEQTEDLRQRIEDLEKQNRDLRAQIGDRDGIASR
ncbi:putative hydrogen voltage-gated channel 1 protein [Eutypa lata UCREL1]|uniref:Voltage-gated hydrogen channel 1 n=1 Tax=Eutypa lata (strain UCR-EL1) TaxID=1287681 RepID=M7T6U6_EUTLA|nr:putative hydrogen voltage-gated channel 1 protein [Eutypa lata UCREL1]